MITAMRTGEPHRTGLEPPLSKVSDWQLAHKFRFSRQSTLSLEYSR